MKKLLTTMALLCLFALCGCEKTYYITNYIGDKNSPGTENGANGGNTDDSGGGSQDGGGTTVPDDQDTPQDGTVLTVEQAMKATDGMLVTVKGYIVGSCTRSIKNTVFEEPFAGKTAIVLRSRPVEDDEMMTGEDGELMPVCVNDYTESSAELNLEDNPDLWNSFIVITGIKTKYLARPGIRYVTNWAFR